MTDGLRVEPTLRRQFGCERKVGAPPVVHAIPSRRALSSARFAVFLTIAAWVAYSTEQLRRYLEHPFSVRGTIEAAVYLVLVTLLTGSACAYLLARLGHLRRTQAHRRTPRALLDAVFDDANPTLTVIVPSYAEESRVIRQTLLSAALQEYPSLRVVLLIDDSPMPWGEHAKELLEAARALPAQIADLLREPHERFTAALESFEDDAGTGSATPVDLMLLASTYHDACQWLRRQAADETVADHVDAFLVNEVILALAEDLATVACALGDAASAEAEVSVARVRHLYRRLVWIFRADLGSFERKRYASLSHEPNKAMNLNSYIGLMGGRYRARTTNAGTVLLPVRGGDFDLEVPDPDYVLTLDADSMLLPEYCLRLVAHMERPENADLAVVQTPYSAHRGAPSRIERLSGATTDLQHIVHQGLSQYGATFWVGANAVLRKRALDSVRTEESHNGFAIRSYISDRTVIEDTESTLDLRLNGWRLENYPERLSFSATPPDFGALCVQRQRWANGGLVVLPRLAALVRRGSRGRRRAMLLEGALRLNYLASIAWASLGLWALLFYPFDQTLLSAFAVLTGLPYFAAMSTDLRRCGYRRLDVLRLYGFNIMLLAVNTAGAIGSIGQAIGGQKVAFARTPKVRSRTIAPLAFVATPFVIVGWSAVTFVNDIADRNYLHAAFAGINGLLTLYAMLALHGLRNSIADVGHDLHQRMYRPPRRAAVAAPTEHDWVTVLYHGAGTSGEARDGAAMATALAAIDQERVASPEISLASSDWQTAGETADGSLRVEQAAVLADALSDHLRRLRPGDAIVLRMDEGSLAVGVEALGADR